MQQSLGYEVDTGECLDIDTMGSSTIKADQVGNQWAYYTGGEGSSCSSKSKTQAAAAPTLQQQQLIKRQHPKRQQPATGGTTGGKETRHYTTQITAAASAARQREHARMDVDAEHTDDDLFEDEADAMDEDNPGQSSKGGDEDPPDDDDDDGDESFTTVPKPKASTRVTNVPNKSKAKQPSFLIEGNASGGSTSISARPTRREKTLASASFQIHWDRARENIREQLRCTVQQLAHHYEKCLNVGGCAIVDTAAEQLNGKPARLLSAQLRETFSFCIQGRYDL